MPVANEQPWEGQAEFLAALATIEGRAKRSQYRGMSTCRLCKHWNGSAEFRLGGWQWPEGFRHYVEKHNVLPSEAFREFVKTEGVKA